MMWVDGGGDRKRSCEARAKIVVLLYCVIFKLMRTHQVHAIT